MQSARLKFVLVFSVMAWLLVGCAVTSTPDAEQSTAPLAESLSEQAQFDFAIDLARMQIERAEYDKAEQLLLKLRRAQAENVEVYRLLAQAYEESGQIELAYITLQVVIKLKSVSLSDEAKFAGIAIQLQKFTQAEAIYQAWLKSEQTQVVVAGLNNLGFSSLLQAQYGLATDYFQQALLKDPLNQKSRHNLLLVNQLEGTAK